MDSRNNHKAPLRPSATQELVTEATRRAYSGTTYRVPQWGSLRQHGKGESYDVGFEEEPSRQHRGRRGGAIHGSLRHFKSPTTTPPVVSPQRKPRRDKVEKRKSKGAKKGTADMKKAKEAETEEEPLRLRVVRAFLSRGGKHKPSSPPVTPNSSKSSRRDHQDRSPYYCVVLAMPKVDPTSSSSTKKVAPILRTTLEGRLCNYGGLRAEEVEWDDVVELPSDGPQELTVEFRMYARRKYLPDRQIGRAELNLRCRGGQNHSHPHKQQHQKHKQLRQQGYRTLVLEKGDAEPKALLEIFFDPPHTRRSDDLPPLEWPFLCTPIEAVKLLAYGRGEARGERSFLGMLPPELVERLCEIIEYNAGFDPFRDGEDSSSAQRDRQFLADTMRMRATSAAHRWKVMRLRSVPHPGVPATSMTSRRSLVAPTTSTASGSFARSTASQVLPPTPSIIESDSPATLAQSTAISPSLCLSASRTARPGFLGGPAGSPIGRFSSFSFWHPHDLEDPVFVRGSRRKGYLISKAMEVGNEHTLTDKHTICFLQSSRADQTFMLREFREATHKAFVWNEETLLDFIKALEKRLQTVAVLEQQRRMLIGGVPALGCTFAVSVPARGLHTVHKRGLRDYELVSVWFVIIDRSCFQFQYTSCTQNPSQSLPTALLAHRKAEENNFMWMIKTFGWRHEAPIVVRTVPKKGAPAPPQPTSAAARV